MVTDVLEHLILFLDADEIARLLPVCRSWLRKLHTRNTWRRQLLDPGSSSRLALPPSFLLSDLNADSTRSILAAIRSLSSPIMNFNIIKQGIFQSSLDDESQGIEKTLDQRKDSFWSSTGSSIQSEKDSLVYQLKHGLCVVKSISITPFRAFYQHGMQCYAPLKARVTVLLFPEDESSVTYSGQWCHLNNVEEPYWFDLGQQLIIGGALRLELEGRWSKQPSDQLYYVCLRDVVCLGVPVAAVPTQEFLEALHNFVRKCETQLDISFNDFMNLLFDDIEALRETIKAELTKQRLMMKCKALIRCRRINDVLEIVFPSYNDDLRFRDEIALQLRQFGDRDLLKAYLNTLSDMQAVLTEEESICLGELAISSMMMKPFVDHVSSLRISFSERLGDVFFEAGDFGCAMTCYSGAMVPDKVLTTCAHLCSKPRTVTYLTILMQTYDNGPETVQTIFEILKEKHHPHIACVFLEKMLNLNFIDFTVAARLLELPSATNNSMRSYMRDQASLYNGTA